MSLTPTQGGPGTAVMVSGSGFQREGTEVRFGGVPVDPAQVELNSATELVVTVPQDARTGLMSVRTIYGTANSTAPFVIDADSTGGPREATPTRAAMPLATNVDPPDKPIQPDDPLASEPAPSPTPTQPITPKSRGTIWIRSPRPDDSRSCPASGVPIDISGTVTLENVADPVVTVKVGSAAAVRANFTDDALAAWTISTKTTQQGSVTITATISARDTQERTISDSAEVTINVAQVADAPW